MVRIIPLFHDGYYQKRAVELFNEAMGYVSQQQYDKAAALFTEATRLDQRKVEYQFYAGISHYLIEDIDSALSFLQTAWDMAPGHVEYGYTYGMVLYRKKAYETAISVLEKVLQKHDHAESMLYLAKSSIELGDMEKAIDILENMIQNGMESSAVYFELGYGKLSLLLFDEAQDCFQKSMHYDRGHILSYYFLSKVWLKKGEHQRAIDTLTTLKQLHPEEATLVDQNIHVIQALHDIR